MSRYPLDKETLQEEYEELLIKLALKKYMEDQGEALAAELERNEENAAKVVNVAFRRAEWRRTRTRVLRGLGKAVTRAAVVFLVLALSATTAYAVFPEVRKSVQSWFVSHAGDGYIAIISDYSKYIPDGWDGVWLLQDTPWNMDIREQMGTSETLYLFYVDSEGRETVLFQSPDTRNILLDEGDAHMTAAVQGEPALLTVRDGETTVYWASGEWSFILTTPYDTETALALANKVAYFERG